MGVSSFRGLLGDSCIALRSDKVKVPAFPRLDEHNARQGFFERGEFLSLLAHLPDDGLRDFVEWCHWTGMRKGEAAALTWDDFDRETWTLRLQAKHARTRRGRVIVLRGAFRDIIERRLAARRLDCPYIFWRPYDGKPTPNLQAGDAAPIQEFRKAWRTACKAAGLKGRLFHDLRRTGVRNLVRAGVSQHVAMQISGHRTDAVFRRYNISTEADLGSAAERVTAYVESLPSTRKVAALPEANGHNSVPEVDRGRAPRRATA
jgi:integrase